MNLSVSSPRVKSNYNTSNQMKKKLLSHDDCKERSIYTSLVTVHSFESKNLPALSAIDITNKTYYVRTDCGIMRNSVFMWYSANNQIYTCMLIHT